jgi:hypothetical protein
MRQSERRLLILIGQINMVWDEIDLLLWYEFDVLLNVHWSFSYSVYYSQQNSRNRRDMISSLAKAALINKPEELKVLERLLKRVDGAASKRNDLTHGIWTTTKRGKKVAIQRLPMKRDVAVMKTKAIEIEDMEATHLQLLHLHWDLRKHIYRMWADKNAAQLSKTKGNSGIDIAFQPLPKRKARSSKTTSP